MVQPKIYILIKFNPNDLGYLERNNNRTPKPGFIIRPLIQRIYLQWNGGLWMKIQRMYDEHAIRYEGGYRSFLCSF